MSQQHQDNIYTHTKGNRHPHAEVFELARNGKGKQMDNKLLARKKRGEREEERKYFF